MLNDTLLNTRLIFSLYRLLFVFPLQWLNIFSTKQYILYIILYVNGFYIYILLNVNGFYIYSFECEWILYIFFCM